MSLVQPTRLSTRRRYPGFDYKHGREVAFSGAEWRQILALDRLQLKTIHDDPGALLAKAGAETRYEIFEDGKAPSKGAA